MTTIVGLKGKDFVILGSDETISAGFFATDYDMKKVAKLDDKIYLGMAGSVATCQMFVDLLRQIIKEYKRKDIPYTVKTIANYFSKLLYYNRYDSRMGFIGEYILGGIDEEPQLYTYDPIGGTSKTKYGAWGSGCIFAYSILDAEYNENITKEEGFNLVLKALKAAGKRDLYSAKIPRFYIVIITKEGVEEYEVVGDKIEAANKEDNKRKSRSRNRKSKT
jgi:proteasome beta subunit